MGQYDVLIVGAGPTGLACGIEARKRGLDVILIEKGCVVNSIYEYPTHMVFFTTPELLEIGELPMTSVCERPCRIEALKYYRRAAEYHQLEIRQYEEVSRIYGSDGDFTVHTSRAQYRARKVIVATGYYGTPNLLNVPGEILPKVMHYYREAYAYFQQDIAVIGGRNSAAITALELHRAGARVTLIHRGERLGVKSWIRPDIEARIADRGIKAYFSSSVAAIGPNTITICGKAGDTTVPNDFVFALTGNHPDLTFLTANGVRLDTCGTRPRINPETFETDRPGLYLAGVVVAGMRTDEIFIENGRFHGKKIVETLLL